MRRRELLAAVTGLAACSRRTDLGSDCPPFLQGFQDAYSRDPRTAAQAWFRSAGLGLFLEYGVYTQLGRGPSVQFDERIPVARYGELGSTFDPVAFDATRLAGIADECGARYVGLTARHADGFSLFRTIETDFNSLGSGGRDLVGELAEACSARELGLLLSYSYAADWRHPYFYPPETSITDWRGARPAYDEPQPEYRFDEDEDFLHYVRYAHHQLEEIAYRYPSLAGIRLGPLAGYRARPDLFPVAHTYTVVRDARPEALVSFGLGANGDEDFAAADWVPAGRGANDARPAASGTMPVELGLSLRTLGPEPRSRSPRELREALGATLDRGANLLLRAELQPDGSMDSRDEQTLLELGSISGA